MILYVSVNEMSGRIVSPGQHVVHKSGVIQITPRKHHLDLLQIINISELRVAAPEVLDHEIEGI